MKNATLILAAVTAFVLSSCASGPAGSPAKKENTAFSWLSTTAVPQNVSR
jgi:hypothetical protein